VRAAADAAPLPALALWSHDHPGDPLVATLYGTALIGAGWAVRGSGRANSVPGAAFETFWDYLAAAEQQLECASGGWAGAPIAWRGLVIASRSLQRGVDEIMGRYEGGVRSGGAGLLELHEQTLQGLCQKWSGSHEQMFAFARAHADPSRPLVTNALPAVAHLEAWVEELNQGGPGTAHLRNPKVQAEIRACASSAWLPGFPTDSGGLGAHNVFAVALFQAGDKAGAARHVHYLGGRIQSWPWVYLGRKGDILADLRR